MDSIEKLYQENIKLTTFTISKWFSNIPQHLYDDILSEASFGLLKACKTFDSTKGFAFSTYAIRVISNQIGMFMRKQNKYLSDVSLEAELSDTENITLQDILGYEPDFESDINYQRMLKLLDKYPNIKLYISGKNQNDMAKITGYSQAQISRLIRKERKRLKAELMVLTG